MTIQEWSDGILVVELSDEPNFSEEINALENRLKRNDKTHVVLSFTNVTHLNSSNIAQLLRLRQKIVNADFHLKLSAVPDSVWGVMMVTGLDKVFDFSPDIALALADLQLEEG